MRNPKPFVFYNFILTLLVFNNPVKDEEDIEFANENGINLTTADSIEELEKI